MMTPNTLHRIVRRPVVRLCVAVAAALVVSGRGSGRVAVLAQGGNPVSIENALTGDTGWDVFDIGDPSIQGFATEISVNRGETINFKINTNSTNYRIDIYRLGYYGGAGARKLATVLPSATLPQTQPACLSVPATGLVDCGNWAVSASWTTTGVVSGIFVARMVRIDTGGASHIVFVVRDDARQADIIVQTSDTTWQAYNRYGGASTYCAPAGIGVSNAGTAYVNACPNRATKVSYNRPFDTRLVSNGSFLFSAEYPMLRFLEANGYNVKYWAGIDTDRRGAELANPSLKPKIFVSSGHDEYWSGTQRARVEAARDAGVHLAFFSGNEVYWKTRYEPSIDGTSTAYRTLVTYKETLAGAKIDPDAAWTGTWRDPRFSPPADGGRPENALTGNFWTVNAGTNTITVPASMKGLRFWRNTRVADLTSGVATLMSEILGYEWDEDLDNGARPAGLMRLSATTVPSVEKITDYGTAVTNGPATHNLTLHRRSNGALVFGAGTIQWAWALDASHDGGSPAAHVPDQAVQQATVNLLADMGVQPATLQVGADPSRPLIATPASADVVPPTSVITAPTAGAQVQSGGPVTITGTATDSGGGVPAVVEVSTDGGATWRPAQGTSTWTFNGFFGVLGPATIKSRAIDDSGNVETPSSGVSVTVIAGTCPCSTIFRPTTVPATPSTGDTAAVEVGVKFKSDIAGFITGIRFYKGPANTGTHIGNLWSVNGTRLATATFTGETASGWQQVNFPAAVPITANTVYVASYHTNVGGYASDSSYFATAGVDSPPLHALASQQASGNGVFRYGASAYPSSTFNATNYYVDVVFAEATIDTTGPIISQVRSTAIDGSNATITWVTNETANSRIEYSTNPALPPAETLTVNDPTNYILNHSVSLTNLTPMATYYFRITSVDSFGNATVALAPSFTMPGQTLRDTASIDFLAGTPGTDTYVSETANGEVILKPAVGTEFSGTTLPAGWISVPFSGSGYSIVDAGTLLVDGARVATCATDGSGVCLPETPSSTSSAIYSAPRSLEFGATFVGDRFQHAGLAQLLWLSSEQWAVFSTGSTNGTLYARTNNSGTITETSLGSTLLGAPHKFRINWQPAQIDYYVDDALVATHTVSITGPLRPVVSDFDAFAGTVVANWARMSPYSGAGSFLSRVFDAATTVNWATAAWIANTPSGTSLAISVRTGNTPTPDATWTNFVPLSSPGSFTATSRYIQYRADLATTDVTKTPRLDDIILTTSRPPVAVNDAAATAMNTAYTFPASGPTSLKNNDTDPDTPLAQLRVNAVTQPAHGTATLNANLSVTYIPQSGYEGMDTFTYTIADGLLTSNAATVTMSVGGRPTANPESATVFQNSGPNTINVLANDTHTNAGQTLTITAVTQGANGIVAIIGGGTAVTYRPNTEFFGTDSFTYTITDTIGNAATTTVTMTVNPINHAPSFTKGPNQSVAKNSGARTVTGWATNISPGPPNEASQTVTFNVSNNNTSLFSAQPAISPTGTLTFTPATGALGTATVTVSLSDNGGTANGGVDTSAPQTFTITVFDPPPVALCQNVTVTATLIGTATASINAGSNDPDGGPVTLAQVPPGPYVPGQTTVTLNVTDSASQTSSCSATVTVTPFAIGASYGFEEASGTTVVDSSGNGNNGTFNATGGPMRVSGGRFGQAMLFDGVDDLITVADSNSLDLTSAMTLMAWIKVDSNTGWRNILMKQNGNDLTYAMYANNHPTLVRQPATFVYGGAAVKSAAATESAVVGQWMHVAATLGGGSLKIYVNGMLERTVAATGNLPVTTGPLTLGGDLVWLDEYFKGVMDEVRILGVELTEADIRTLMRTPVVPGTPLPATDPTGLVAAYNFNDGTATDRTGLGHNGVVNGAVSAAGIYGNALSFNGTSNLVSIADANDLDFTSALTLEAWVYPATVSGWRSLILKEGGPTGLVYSIYGSDAAQHPAAFINIAGQDQDARSATSLPINTWSHVVLTYNKSLSEMKIYVDGIPRDTRVVTGDVTISTGSLFFGGNSLWGEYFNGRMDNVRLYNRALSIVEIQTNQATPIN